MTTKIRCPLLAVGTFGVHILDNPTGTWGFFGEVPAEFRYNEFRSYADAFDAFVGWLRVGDRAMKYADRLREDVKIALLADNHVTEA